VTVHGLSRRAKSEREMKPRRMRSRVGWLGFAASVIAIGLTVRPIHASAPVFWLLVGLAAMAIGFAVVGAD
jgi:hypothetical protein